MHVSNFGVMVSFETPWLCYTIITSYQDWLTMCVFVCVGVGGGVFFIVFVLFVCFVFLFFVGF